MKADLTVGRHHGQVHHIRRQLLNRDRVPTAVSTPLLLVDDAGTTRSATAIPGAFALRRSRKIIRGLKEGLTEEERYAVAEHAVAQLKECGDPWRLNEETRTAGPPST